MIKSFGGDNKSALEAKTDAQKLAFAPLMFHAARAIRDFGILKILLEHKEGLTLEEIIEKTNLSRYGATVLLEASLSMELVYISNGKFKITKTGFFIERDEMTNVNMDFVHDIVYKGAYYLKESIETGKPVGLHKTFGKWDTIYKLLAKLPTSITKNWFRFDHFYSSVAFEEVLPVIFESSPLKILDLGGNTGKFAIACIQYSEEVGVTIMDLPGQLEHALTNIREEGYEERIDTYPADFLDKEVSLPEGYDIIWMSQFLDCFSEEEIVGILERIKKVMKSSSELYILETFWDKQKFDAVTYSLHATSLYFTCMANGNSRMYSSNVMKQLIRQAGLKLLDEKSNIGLAHTLLKCKK